MVLQFKVIFKWSRLTIQALCGFTCSDEITLVFPAWDPETKKEEGEAGEAKEEGKEVQGEKVADDSGKGKRKDNPCVQSSSPLLSCPLLPF